MTANVCYEVSLSSLVAAAYQSATSNTYFALDNVCKPVGYTFFGSGSGVQLAVNIDGCISDPNQTTPTWQHVLNVDAATTASASKVNFQGASLAHQPLLPYARVQVVAKSTTVGGTTVSNIIARLLAEKIL